MENIILLCLAVLPVFVLGFFVYRKDKFEKEPVRMLLKAFIYGCLSVVPAIFLEQLLSLLYTNMGGDSLPGVFQGAYTGYIVAGCSEELSKLVLLTLVIWKSREFNEYFDGVVYATFVSLGFAGLENVMYVFGQDSYASALATGSMRAILSVPGHFLFGVVMGYYFALAKFQPENRSSNFFKAFFYPMLLHGTYDALLMIPEAMGEDTMVLSGILFVLFIFFDIRLWKIGMRRLNHLQELSQQQAYSYDDNAGYDDEGGDDDNYQGGGNSNSGDAFSGFNWDV